MSWGCLNKNLNQQRAIDMKNIKNTFAGKKV